MKDDIAIAHGVINACMNHGLHLASCGNPTSELAVERVLHYLFISGERVGPAFLKDPDPRVRKLYFAYAVGPTDEVKMRPMLDDPDSRLRLKYYKICGYMYQHGDKLALHRAVVDPKAIIRRRAFFDVGFKECIRLTGVDPAKDKDSWIRYNYYSESKWPSEAAQDRSSSNRYHYYTSKGWDKVYTWVTDKSWKIRACGICFARCPCLKQYKISVSKLLQSVLKYSDQCTSSPEYVSEALKATAVDKSNDETLQSYASQLPDAVLKKLILQVAAKDHLWNRFHRIFIEELKRR